LQYRILTLSKKETVEMSKKTWEQLRILKKENKKLKLRLKELDHEISWYKKRCEIMKRSFTEQTETKDKKIKELIHSKKPVLSPGEKEIYDVIEKIKSIKHL
jgi:predicted RNase H-like nuclease (RuvC/YqgF family)